MDKLEKFNIESWNGAVLFYESFANTWYEKPLQPVLVLVKQLAQTERAKLFQAGHSIYNLIISTTDYWGLKDEDRFVIAEPKNPDFLQFQVQYQNHTQVFESQTCDSTHLRSTIEPMLNRLWTDTHGHMASCE